MVKITNIPKTSGIYYFYEDDKLLYVGKAVNLKRRVQQHKFNHSWASIHNDGLLIDIVFNRVTKIKILFIDKTLIGIIEKVEIKKLKPVLNHETYGDDPIFEEIKEYHKMMLQKVHDTL